MSNEIYRFEMEALAMVLEAPQQLALRRLPLTPPTANDVVVDIEWSGISTGTERLLYSGRMPPFPGMGYPLVPGYESVGRIVEAGAATSFSAGEHVFVPGASCFGEIRGLFGGSASRLVVPAARVLRIDPQLGERGTLLALAATAQHMMSGGHPQLPELIVGHGVLGRLLARVTMALGGAPVVWETNTARASGATGYRVVEPKADPRRDYNSIVDASGDASVIDSLIHRLARGGELVLAGFYSERISFAFATAFMKEARIRVSAEWLPNDLRAALELVSAGRLSLDGLITHRADAKDAPDAYRTAFEDPTCLKMLLDWRAHT